MSTAANALCYGGSFDPVHVGHLVTARAAAEATGANIVRLIVAGQSPHKLAGTSAPAADRVAMLRAAVAGDPLFVVDERELHREGPSYTADTARELSRKSGAPVAWLVGADLLPGLPRWREAEALLSDPPTILQFVAMRRGGHTIDLGALPPAVRKIASAAVKVPEIEISSSDVRARVAAGRSIRYLVPDAVVAYIEQKNLYAASSAKSG